MVRKNKSHIPLAASQEEAVLPVISFKNLILLPGETVSLQIWRPGELQLIKESNNEDSRIAVIFGHPSENRGERIELLQIGTEARILSVQDAPGDSQLVVLQGVRRIALLSIKQEIPFIKAAVSLVDDGEGGSSDAGQLSEEIIRLLALIHEAGPGFSDDLAEIAELNRNDPGQFADRIAACVNMPFDERREILESVPLAARLKNLHKYLQARQREFQKPGRDAKAPEKVAEDAVCRQLKSQVKQSKSLPLEAYDRCLIEIDRLGRLSTASAEYGTTRQYIDWLVSIPWNVFGRAKYNLERIEKKIDKEYYGSQDIKKRILERIAVRRLSGNSSDGPILCLAGVPGTGKASLARAIAGAMGKKFIRISVGGIDEVSDIKGIPRTYLGAMPGIIIRALKDAGTSDPVIFIEDIDYFAEDASSALSMSLLQAIDPKYNRSFIDDYIGLPIDLSRVFFICAVKSVENVPEVFGHRLEVIELPGYIEKEKIHIARKYLIPTVLKKHGLLARELVFSENGLKKIIRNYTMEAGLLKFKRRIERICRHVAREKAGGTRKAWMVNEKTVESFLGTPRYMPEKPDKSPEIGVAIGLAWTGTGGDLMIIEGLRMKGSGEVITTGSLGDVMKESIQAAHSYVRSKADILGIDHADFNNFDIHIHFPSGAIPKDGPSAGAAVSLVIASLMAERPISNDIAMTGEVTLRGKVLQVGGLVEKVSAAYRAGIRKVFVPKGNKKDLKALPADILKKTKFIFIETVDELFAKGLLDFTPSSYTLEKLFAEEIKKAKDRRKSPATKGIAAKSSKKK
jgi:ATP-dependent Lon protease